MTRSEAGNLLDIPTDVNVCENDSYVRLDAYALVQTYAITMESAPELKHTPGMGGGGEKERQKGNVHKELNQIKRFGIRLTTCPEEE